VSGLTTAPANRLVDLLFISILSWVKGFTLVFMPCTYDKQTDYIEFITLKFRARTLLSRISKQMTVWPKFDRKSPSGFICRFTRDRVNELWLC